MRNEINIAINICTFKREDYIYNNIKLLLESKFFDCSDMLYYSHLFIFIVDNGGTIDYSDSDFIKVIKNRNVGGAGGFQKGIEEIRKSERTFSHVVFMDDDVEFDVSCFYILYDFLCNASEENLAKPIAGRMFCKDRRDVQYTAAEVWNRGNIKHIGFMKNVNDIEKEPDVNDSSEAQYGGWWLCCYPFSFVKDNDVIPFFIHCDDVEYGLRLNQRPIILKGFQVWHETYDKRITPLIQYYDTRNPLFVNEKYNLLESPQKVIEQWKEKITSFHIQKDWDSEYFTILGFRDFLRGLEWLYSIDPEKKHISLCKKRGYRWKNAFVWRYTEWLFKKKYRVGKQ